MRSFVTGKTINKQVQFNNRLTTFTNPPIQVGDLFIPRDLYVGGNLTVQGNVFSYGTIKAQQFFTGQVIYMNMFNFSEIGQASNLSHISGGRSANHVVPICSKLYTPSNNNSNIIIEYQTICSLDGSNSDSITFYLKVNGSSITYLPKYYDATDLPSRLPTLIQLNGRYQPGNTNEITIAIVADISDTDDTLTINGNTSTWLKITEVGR